VAFDASREIADLLEELVGLIRQERELSAVRRRLHTQLDVGFPNDVTPARERQISDKRLRLHRRIDALREELGPLWHDPSLPLAERRWLRELGL
jgi:hypothetical protein